nr:3'(2'),5'-bisphosphate nucleotidase CysQ [Brucella intermedia]
MIDLFTNTALAAGQLIMRYYETRPVVQQKPDQSPVTDADLFAERVIFDALSYQLPGIPIVAEEAVAEGRIPNLLDKSFILVDPLDGTKEFIDRRGDFTVNIAFIERGFPVCGVVYAPALRVIYGGDQSGAWKQMMENSGQSQRLPIAAREPGRVAVAVTSRSHMCDETVAYLKKENITKITQIGSSLKFCLIAEGRADVYPRLGRTMQWDTAAGDAILRSAGGHTRTLDGLPLKYGSRGGLNSDKFVNPHFVSCGRSAPFLSADMNA